MTGSLDYRAGSITWHTREAIALVPNKFHKRVLTPAKKKVNQLHKEQPLQYSAFGGGMLYLSMPNIYERLVYYLRYSLNVTVRPCISILNKYPCFKKKLAQLNLYQGKQDPSPNDKPPVGLRSGRNAANPRYIFVTNSTPISDLPELLSQCGHVQNISMRLSRPSTMDSLHTHAQLCDKKLSIPRSCKYHKPVYDRQFEQDNSTDLSPFINVSVSKDSNTNIERCKSSGSYDKNNCDDACQFEQECLMLSSSQSSCNYQVSRFFHDIGNLYMKHTESEYEPTRDPSNNPSVSRNQTINLFNTSDPSVSQSDENSYCLIQKSDQKPVIEKVNDAQNVFFYFKKYLFWILVLCVWCIISKIIFPRLNAIFKSKLLATIFTFIIILYYSVLISYFYMEYK